MEWISVKDKLPKEGELVLAVGVRGGVFLGYKPGSAQWKYQPSSNKDVCTLWVPNTQRHNRDATHWLPIPELPKED